jgi:O-antigen/teichoic acid export membrane protein
MLKDIIVKIRKKYLPSGSFREDFFTMATGRTLSQLIPLLITPILTRLYTPADFGIFAIFLSLVTVIALLANGRYNLAITLPKKERKAMELFIICIIGVITVSVFCLLIGLFFQNGLLGLLGLQGKVSFIYLVPLGVLIVALIESIYYWLLRLRSYKFLSKNIIIQTSSTTVFKLLFAFLAWGWFGLIFAHILGALLSLILLTIELIKSYDFKLLQKELKIKDLLNSVKKYKRFPTLSLPADGINSIANQLPTILLNNLFNSSVVGYYSLTQRVLGLPITFVSSAMTDVFRERASTDYREKGNCRGIFLETFKYLSLLSILPFVLLFLFAPYIVPFILGNQWILAGEYIRILSLMYMFRFIASPLSSTLYINGKQGYLLLWQIGLLVCTVVSFYVGYNLGNEKTSLLLFSISYSLMYVILLLLGYKFTKKLSL